MGLKGAFVLAIIFNVNPIVFSNGFGPKYFLCSKLQLKWVSRVTIGWVVLGCAYSTRRRLKFALEMVKVCLK